MLIGITEAAAATAPPFTSMSRRETFTLLSINLIACPPTKRPIPSGVPAVPLQDFDLVAVGILQKKELGQELAVAEKLLDRRRLEALIARPLVLAGDVVGRQREMAIGRAMGIRLAAPVIDGELDLEIV